MLDSLLSLPLDPIFALQAEFLADPQPEKINLGIGVYSDELGHPFVFPSVKKAVADLDIEDFDYQPIIGKPEFMKAVSKLMFGSRDSQNMAMIATCGGTQACRIFSDLMAREGKREILIATPTWGNHFQVFEAHTQKKFDHLKPDGTVNVEGYRQAIQNSADGSVLLLHGGLTHNPTGRNLTKEDLTSLIPLIREKKAIVFVDFAYCGLGDSWQEDLAWMHLLWDSLIDIAVGVSFSKNVSLYEHRTGALFVKTDRKAVIQSHLQDLVRRSVSMAPVFGQEVFFRVLERHQSEWHEELEGVRRSIEYRKSELLKRLPSQFSVMKDARGMFALLPLTEKQILRLRKDHAIYIPTTKRINFAGLQTKAIDRIAEGIVNVIKF